MKEDTAFWKGTEGEGAELLIFFSKDVTKYLVGQAIIYLHLYLPLKLSISLLFGL